MKEIFILILISSFITSCSSQIKDKSSILSEFLEPKSYQFEILDSIVMTPKQNDLQLAFQKAYTQKIDSFNLYFENKHAKKKYTFPKNDFISITDFEEYLSFIENVKIISSGVEKVLVNNNNHQISFESSNKLKSLNHIKYDIKSNSFEINNQKLTFLDSINANNQNKLFKESWSGYSWRYCNLKPKELEVPMSNLIKKNFINYKVTVGLLDVSKEVFIEIILVNIKDGEKILNYDLTIKENKSL